MEESTPGKPDSLQMWSGGSKHDVATCCVFVSFLLICVQMEIVLLIPGLNGVFVVRVSSQVSFVCVSGYVYVDLHTEEQAEKALKRNKDYIGKKNQNP